MRLDSPILALIALPLLAWTLWRTRRPVKFLARWAVRAATILLWLAIAGAAYRWQRLPVIAVMVDVSPSTRGALLRDPEAVKQRLAPLLDGRTATVHYFADGIREGANNGGGEAAVGATRLEVPAADAVILLSDGRLDAPASLPPLFTVVDPSLDHPGDARVESLTAGERATAVFDIDGAARSADIDGARPAKIEGLQGRRMIPLAGADGRVIATINGGDRWPENDRLTTDAPPKQGEMWAVDASVGGARSVPLNDVPHSAGGLVGVSAVVLPTQAALQPDQAAALRQYVSSLGGTLILVGPPGEAAGPLREIAPLTVTPPKSTGQWVVLLDTSGSMAGAGKWLVALSAARSAVATLPADAAVSLVMFSRQTQVISDHASPAAVAATLQSLQSTEPNGPTGLRAALESIKPQPGGETHVLLVTDGDASLGDTADLAKSLKWNGIRVMALLTSPSPAVQQLAEATGGAAVADAKPSEWDRALTRLAANTLSRELPVQQPIAGEYALKGVSLHSKRRWTAWLRDSALSLANVGDDSVAAMWHAGAGQAVSISADVTGDDLANIIQQLHSPADDPRFAVGIDSDERVLHVSAAADGQPMNSLQLSVDRAGKASPMQQTAPGDYELKLATYDQPTVAVIRLNDRIISRKAIAGRYPREFDRIGNDRAALKVLAERTGGKLIEPGDNQPIEVPVPTEWRSLQTAALIGASVLALAGLAFLRMPYWEDRIARAICP